MKLNKTSVTDDRFMPARVVCQGGDDTMATVL